MCCPIGPIRMPVDQDRRRATFERLDRQLTKLSAKPIPENVHRFRTYGRRLEALLEQLVPEPSRNDRKLLKMLARLRKKAGCIRDLDVQVAALRNLRIPQEPARKSQLLRSMTEDRGKRERKLAKALDNDTLRELRKRLKRATKTKIPGQADPLAMAVDLLAKLGQGDAPPTEKVLHQFRIVGKRARYLAELAGPDPKAERLIEQLKHMQDVLGDWHDWLKLTERAQRLFGATEDSPLLSALRNVTRAKFRQATLALTEMRAAMAGRKPVSPETTEPRRAAGHASSSVA